MGPQSGPMRVSPVSCFLGEATGHALSRRLLLRGKITHTMVPFPSVLVTRTLPPCSLTSLCTIISPTPFPATCRLTALLPLKWFLNSFFRSSGGMPIPVSSTSTPHTCRSAKARTWILPPRGVYFSALDSIFFNIESILSLSNRTFR